MATVEQFLSNPIVAQVLGLIVGLFTSFFSWWMLFHWLAPTILFSSDISKTIDDSAENETADHSGTRYRIKLVNIGRRSIIDLEVRAIVRIKGLTDPTSTVWQVVHLSMSASGDLSYSFPKMNPLRKSKLWWLLRVHTNSIESCTRFPFPPHIRTKAIEKTLLLEDLLALGTKSEVRVIASGFDEFSGARKVQEKIYSRENIKFGQFQKRSLDVDEEPNPLNPLLNRSANDVPPLSHG